MATAAVVFTAASAYGTYAWVNRPIWPEIVIPGSAEALSKKLVYRWQKEPVAPVKYKFEHDPFGAYFHRGSVAPCKPKEDQAADANGIVMQKMGTDPTPYYHPVLLARCGLNAFLWSQRGGDDGEISRSYADQIISMQDERGAIPYPFSWSNHLTGVLKPGWTSGMAQGMAISLFARIYHQTKDEKYLKAGEQALSYLLTPVTDGGVMTTMADLDPSLSGYIFFEEYVTQPANYVLNGYIFALLGLYDWSFVEAKGHGQDLAKSAFDRGMDTLLHILPYYDIGGITAVDLGYITHPDLPPRSRQKYHILHARQLNLMYQLTGIATIKDYEQKWISYFTDPQR